MSHTRSIIQQLLKPSRLPEGGFRSYASPAQIVTSRLAEASWKTDRVEELCNALKEDGAKSVSEVRTSMELSPLWKAVYTVYGSSPRTYYLSWAPTYFEDTEFHAAVKGSNIVCVRAAGFIGDFAAFIVTDDSPEKVLRKLSAHVNGLAESQRINESTWIQGLADELVDDGAKAAYVIRMPLAIYELRKASQLAYSDAVKTYFIPGSMEYMEYSVDRRFHRRAVGATIVVVQSEQQRDCAVFIITDDSPEKVVRKLAVAAAEGSA